MDWGFMQPQTLTRSVWLVIVRGAVLFLSLLSPAAVCSPHDINGREGNRQACTGACRQEQEGEGCRERKQAAAAASSPASVSVTAS